MTRQVQYICGGCGGSFDKHDVGYVVRGVEAAILCKDCKQKLLPRKQSALDGKFGWSKRPIVRWQPLTTQVRHSGDGPGL